MLHLVASKNIPEYLNGWVWTPSLRAYGRDLVPDTRWQVNVETNERWTHVDDVYRKLEWVACGRYNVHAER